MQGRQLSEFLRNSIKKRASSAESVGKFQLWESAKVVIKG